MFYRPWKVEKGVAAVPFEVVWNRLVGFCWVVQLSGWLRFSCWTSSCSLEDDRACVARRFPWWAEREAATLLHEELDEKRRCAGEARLDSLLRCRRKAARPLALGEVQEEPVCSSRGDVWGKRDWAATLLLWEGSWRESEEGENMPYIGPVTSQVMGLRVTNGSWNLCLLSVFTPLCDAEAPGKLSSFTQ